jgi:hypothetical protein
MLNANNYLVPLIVENRSGQVSEAIPKIKFLRSLSELLELKWYEGSKNNVRRKFFPPLADG